MESLQIVDVKDREFSTKTEHDGSLITVQMRGNWDMKAVTPLDEFTRSVQTQAKRLKVERVVVDLAEVEFMNSSCLKSFAKWAAALGKGNDEPYSLTFRTEAAWQRRSLDALKVLAGGKVIIEA